MLEWVGLPQNSIDAILRESVTLQLLWDMAMGAANPRIEVQMLPLEPMTPESLAERQEREIDLAQELYDFGGDIDMANLFRLHELERKQIESHPMLRHESLYQSLMDQDFDALRIYMDDSEDVNDDISNRL